MIFGVDELVSYISRYMTLLPGDIISTGTPFGVGLGLNPPVYLRAGDRMKLGVQGLGHQNQEAVEWTDALDSGRTITFYINRGETRG